MNLQPAIDLIKEFEGFRSKAYKCPAGVWTVGYGSTIGVKPTTRITRPAAERKLVEDILRDRVPVIRDLVAVKISDNELCALVSFVYNVGNGAFGKSTLLRKLNAGSPRTAVALEFAKWTKAGGKQLEGLVRRRKAEAALFLKPADAEVKRMA